MDKTVFYEAVYDRPIQKLWMVVCWNLFELCSNSHGDLSWLQSEGVLFWSTVNRGNRLIFKTDTLIVFFRIIEKKGNKLFFSFFFLIWQILWIGIHQNSFLTLWKLICIANHSKYNKFNLVYLQYYYWAPNAQVRTDCYDIWHVLKVLTRLILVTVRGHLVANEMWKNILGKSWRRLVYMKRGRAIQAKSKLLYHFSPLGKIEAITNVKYIFYCSISLFARYMFLTLLCFHPFFFCFLQQFSFFLYKRVPQRESM